MSVGGWLTENHHRPVAARETSQQSSAQALQQEAHPTARPVAATTESGRGAPDPAWGICQHNSALQRPLICDTPTPLIVRKELLRPGGSRRAAPALAVLAARLTAPCSAPRWPEPPLRDEEALGRAQLRRRYTPAPAAQTQSGTELSSGGSGGSPARAPARASSWWAGSRAETSTPRRRSGAPSCPPGSTAVCRPGRREAPAPRTQRRQLTSRSSLPVEGGWRPPAPVPRHLPPAA